MTTIEIVDLVLIVCALAAGATGLATKRVDLHGVTVAVALILIVGHGR